MYKLLVFTISISATTILSGCGTTSDKSKLQQDKMKTTSQFVYSPKGREEFVFNENNGNQNFGNFCKKERICSRTLNFEKYKGMRGYFKVEEPVVEGNWLYWPVVLENGEEYFYMAYKEKYISISGVIPLKEYQASQNFKAIPLVPNSETMLVSFKNSHGVRWYKTNTGKELSQKKVDILNEINSKFNAKPELIESLIDMRVNKDEFENTYTIKASKEIGFAANNYSLTLEIDSKGSLDLTAAIIYTGRSWLFANNYKIAADDYRWESENVAFTRENKGGKVWEFAVMTEDRNIIMLSQKLANADKSTIRILGDKGKYDLILNSVQKNNIKEVYNLYEAFKL